MLEWKWEVADRNADLATNLVLNILFHVFINQNVFWFGQISDIAQSKV